ncbi:60S ribosomal protein L4 [Gurleya vavrai]
MQDLINVYNLDGTTTKTHQAPKIFSTPISTHCVTETFRRMNMDARQPYAVNKEAGKQHSAEGWGTGRAVARVPRVKGSGTRRAGQAAFANFARKGRMAHPTKVTRRWHRKVTLNERLHALSSGIAASAVPSLVQSRGHLIENLNSVPLVVKDEIHSFKKTKEAFALLKMLGLEEELKRVKESRNIRAGMGKMRNRKYRQRKGILLVHNGEGLKAFRNIPGIEIKSLKELSLLDVCPGGHLGRLILWTEDAFINVEKIFDVKENYKRYETLAKNDNVEDLFYSAEVQAILEDKKYEEKFKNQDPVFVCELNPYLNLGKEIGV